MAWGVNKWTYESLQEKRQRELATLGNLAAAVRPLLRAGDYAGAQAAVQAIAPPKKKPSNTYSLDINQPLVSREVSSRVNPTTVAPKKKSGGLLGNIGSALGDLGGVANDVLGKAEQGLGTAFSAPYEYVGKPIEGALANHYKAVGAASLLPVIGAPAAAYTLLGETLGNYGASRARGEEIQQAATAKNPYLGALNRTIADPLSYVGGLSGAGINAAFNLSGPAIEKYGQDIPGWNMLSPEVQQALILGGSAAVGHFGPKLLRGGATAAEEAAVHIPVSEQSLPEGGLAIGGGAAAVPAIPGQLTADVPQGPGIPTNLALPLNPGAPEAGVRVEGLLKPRSAEQLGPDYTVKDALDVAHDLARQQSSTANALHSYANVALRELGKMDDEGHMLDVAPSQADIAAGLAHPSFYDVVQDPDMYHLSLDQLHGIERMVTIIHRVRDERELRGVGPKMLKIDGDGEFFPRKAKLDSKGRDLTGKGGVGSRLGGAKDKSRVFATAREGEAEGVRYENPVVSIDDYVARGLKLSADSHMKGLLEKFSQTPKDRVPAGIRSAYQDAVTKLASVRARLSTAEKRAGLSSGKADELDKALQQFTEATPVGVGNLAKTPKAMDRLADRALKLDGGRQAAAVQRAVGALDALIPDDVERLRSLDTALLRTAQRTETLAQRGGHYAAEAAELKADLAEAEQALEAVKGPYRQAVERSRQVPPDRATVPQNLAPALTGHDFEPKVAQRIANYYGRNVIDTTTQTGKARKVVRAINTALVPVKATLDASSIVNQQGRTAVSHPLLFLTNVAKSLRDVADARAYDEMMASPKGLRAARAGVVLLGKAGERNELQLTNWVQRIPVAGKLAQWAENHYERFNNRMRVDLFDVETEFQAKVGRPLDARGEEQLAKALNRLTGVSTGRAGDLETLGMFAPNFFRSHLESVAHALTDGSIEGQVARRYLGAYFAAGATITGMVAASQGRDPSEVLNPFDLDALSRGELRLNPNFGTVRVNGADISLYGPFMPLARLAAAGVEAGRAAVVNRDPKELLAAVGYAASSKGSPLVAFGSDLAQGETFTGADPLSLSALVERVVPISISQVIAGQRQGLSTSEAVLEAAVNVIGGSANPMTPTERLDKLAVDKYGKGFYDLGPKDQAQLKAENPALWQEAIDRGSEDRKAYQAQRTQYQAQQQSLDDAFLAGKISQRQWDAQRGSIRDQLAGAGNVIYGGDTHIDNPRDWKQRYGNILFDNTDRAGIRDWDAIDAAVAQLPAEDQKNIAEQAQLALTPLVAQYKAASREYYDIPQYRGLSADQGRELNDAYAQVRQSAKSGQQIDMLRALRQMGSELDPEMAKLVRRKILGLVREDTKRTRWAKANPGSAYLLGLSAGDVTKVGAV